MEHNIYSLPSPFALQALLPVDNLLIGIRELGSLFSKVDTTHPCLQVIKCGYVAEKFAL